jgi:hypothetical protein
LNLEKYLSGFDWELVIIFAPLGGSPAAKGQPALGGMTIPVHGREVNCCVFSDVPHGDEVWKDDYGREYPLAYAELVDEILHCVEVNARMNGQTGFESADSAEENGYTAGEQFEWCHDLMTDRLRSGKQGFTPEAYLVAHWPIESLSSEHTSVAFPALLLYNTP